MFYAPVVRSVTGAHDITHPNQRVWRRMQIVADIIGGSVDVQPGHRHPALSGCLLMTDAGLLIAGTATRRPMWFAEGRSVAQLTSLDILLVRACLQDITFDVYLSEERTWLVHYILWQRDGASWLIPTAGYGPFVRVTQHGLFTSLGAPFTDRQDRQAGLTQLSASSADDKGAFA